MWLSEIAFRKPILRNYSIGGMQDPIHGLVLHIEQGTEDGTYSQFNATQAQLKKRDEKPASAHFGNPKSGPLQQFINTEDVAWAQVAGNLHWISVENEGKSGDYLTYSQIENVAKLFAWLRWYEDVPLQLANSPTDFGLGYHSMGGKAWGDHPDCPGRHIISQRQQIIRLASAIPLNGIDNIGNRGFA